jgi:hypothetical protein
LQDPGQALALLQVLALARRRGWQRCPRCVQLVERRDGCAAASCGHARPAPAVLLVACHVNQLSSRRLLQRARQAAPAQ